MKHTEEELRNMTQDDLIKVTLDIQKLSEENLSAGIDAIQEYSEKLENLEEENTILKSRCTDQVKDLHDLADSLDEASRLSGTATHFLGLMDTEIKGLLAGIERRDMIIGSSALERKDNE